MHADRVASSGAPQRAGLVLTALILGAAVANLNLAVANVALPSIGKAFDSSQTSLNLIAVGYSLGLAASVLYLGAIGDRYGRKLMLVLGITLSDPGVSVGGVRPQRHGADLRPHLRWDLRGHGLPDDAGIGRGPVVRSGTDQDDRALVGARRRDLVVGAADVRLPARALLVGLGLPGDAAVGARRAGDGRGLRAGPRQRGHRPGRQPGRCPVGADDRCAGDRHQLRRRTRFEDVADRHGRHRVGRRRCLLPAAAADSQSALRPRRRGASDLLGRRARRHHRLRLADGCDVHRPAVPAERARLLDPRGGDIDHSCGADDGADRPALRHARRIAWCSFHIARRLRVRVPRLPHDAPPLEGGQCLLAGCPRVRAGRHRCRVRGNPGLALAHRGGTGPSRRHGVGDRRSAAGPGRCRDAEHLRCPAGRRLRLGVHLGDRQLVRCQQGVGQHRGSADQVVRQRQLPSHSRTRSTPARSRPRRRSPSSPATSGPTPPASWRCSSAPRWWRPCFRARIASRSCSRRTTRRTWPPRARRVSTEAQSRRPGAREEVERPPGTGRRRAPASRRGPSATLHHRPPPTAVLP